MISRAGAPPLEDPPPGPFAGRPPTQHAFLSASPHIGRNGFPREVLDQHHRNRVLRGAVASLAECGYIDTSVERLIATAGVSRYTFYAHYADKEACFLAAYDQAHDWLVREVSAALLDVGGWADRVHVAVESTLALLAADLGLARLLASEILCIGPAGRNRRRTLVEQLVPLLRLGRADYPTPVASTPRMESALLFGAITVIDRELAAGRGERLAELAPDLTEFLLVPYLGHAQARRVVKQRASAPDR